MRPGSAILGLLLFAVPVLHAGEALDRVVATVNGHVILQSDWQDEVRYECFVAGRVLQSLSPQDRQGALDRLVDQELLRQQMHVAEVNSASIEEVDKQIETIKGDYARDHSAQPWAAALSTYHLTEAYIRNHIALELSQLRLVDARLRPTIQIDAAAIEAYYKEHLATNLSNAQPTGLQEASPKIRELLTQEKMNQLLSSWLETLRSQARIRMFVSDSSETQGQGQ